MSNYVPKVYKKAGGDVIVVASGGKIEIESGGEIELQSGAIADIVDKVLEGADIALADGKILIGDATGKAVANTPSGDVTMTNAGVTAIAADAVTNTKLANIARGSVKVGGASDAPTDLDCKAAGAIPVGDGTDVLARVLSGDVTVNGSGVSAIAAGVIVNADIAAGAAIAASKLANYADLAAMIGAGLANSASYVKTDDGTKTLLAAHATKDRGVLVVVHVDEVFADGDTSQLIVQVGEDDTVAKAFASAVFTNAALGTFFVTGFKNLATKKIIATLTAAVGTGTGACSITVFALPNS